MAKVYSIYETKSRLSEILRQVKTGKEVIVSERGTMIAKIIPFREELNFETKFQNLVQSGQILPRTKNLFTEGSSVTKGAVERFLEERD